MWYVVNVRPGHEEQALQLLQEHAAACGVQELFVPRCEVRECGRGTQCSRDPKTRRRGGDARVAAESMIPGCAIAVAPSAREVRAMLRRARGVGEMLRPDAKSFEALDGGEVALIERLIQPGLRVAAFSEGCLEGGRVVVTSGPLQGLEDAIVKVDHHKKRAYLRLSIAGREVNAVVGLRITAKRESAA